MKHSDVEARQQQDRQDWQKRGMGGLVSTVDPATGTVTISVTGFDGSKNVAVHTTKDTIVRRYAPDSVKFDEAKASTLEEIHAGDQLRARGDRSADGTDLAAAEIVSGSFRNIAGTVSAVDPASIEHQCSGFVVEGDRGGESNGRIATPSVARRDGSAYRNAFEERWRRFQNNGGELGQWSNQSTASLCCNGAGRPRSTGEGRGRAPDLQQLSNHVPAVTLADLHKGDAVLIVSTPGAASAQGTVITLVSGVDPILRAAPSAGQAMMLAPWSLGAPAEAGSQ